MIHIHRTKLDRGQSQQGVVLIVVLVLLVAVTFMSVNVMRGALNTDVMANNARTQTLATEMAQLALLFCEDDLRKAMSDRALFTSTSDIQPSVTPGATMAWKVKDKWVGTNPAAKTLDAKNLAGVNSAFAPTHRPQCLAEYSPDTGPTSPDRIIVVTARGFSPDYNEDNSNNVTSGSVAWLQSRFIF